MEIYLICLAAALVGGLMLSRLTKLINLPAVTAYLVAGLLLGPFCLGRLQIPGLGFQSLEQVEALTVITETALGFIAFTIGNEFRLSQLKAMGSKAIVIGVLQAVITTVLVDVVLIVLHLCFPQVITLPCALVLGAIASATAPAATLMVVRQYKADGPLTRLLMLVVAIDDAVGLLLFSVSFGVASALSNGQVSVLAVVVEPLLEIVLSLGLGALMGWLLNFVEQFFHSNSKRMTISVAFVLLTVGLSSIRFEFGGIHFGFSLLLVCMMTGTVFCNICSTSEELMERVEKWVTPLHVLFFVISGAELDLAVLVQPVTILIGVIYILEADPAECSHYKEPGHHPAAPGRCGVGYGADRRNAAQRRCDPQCGVVCGSDLRIGGPRADQAVFAGGGRNSPRGPHQCQTAQCAQNQRLNIEKLPVALGPREVFCFAGRLLFSTGIL